MWTAQAQQQAGARAWEAIKTIERLVPQEQKRSSQKRRQTLLRAYQTLSRQSPVLGIGIAALGNNPTLEKLLSGAQHFKQQVEQRSARSR